MLWVQERLAEVVQKGDLVLDLTVGTGQDTLFLHELVGVTGQIVGFDIQEQALVATRQQLLNAGANVRLQQSNVQLLSCEPGIDLVHWSHAEIGKIVPAAPQAIIANLGYLPGGDQEIITHPETTLLALEQACVLLAVGGRLAVVVYPGHPGGAEEGRAVTAFFTAIDDSEFHVIQFQVSNRPQAPFLFVAEKIGAKKK